MVGKCLQLQRLKQDEIQACCIIRLVIAMLENITEIGSVIPSIVDMYVNEVNQGVEIKEYNIMLLQGFMMCMWYDCNTTLIALEQAGKTEWLLQQVFEQVTKLTEDFEVKRFMLGLSAVLIPAEMPVSVANNYATIIKVLVYLSGRSVEIYEQSMQVKQKEDMAEVENDGAIIEDEDYDEIDIESDEDDDDWDGSDDEDEQNELYESPLDKVNEVLVFHEKMANLQTAHKELYDYLCA